MSSSEPSNESKKLRFYAAGQIIPSEKVYIVSPSIKAELRKQSKDTGSGQLTYMNGEINGITTLCSSKAQGIVLGDFSNYYICQWGAVN